jgi:hypothetical protein
MLIVMSGSNGSGESMHSEEATDADLPNPDADLNALAVYNIFLKFIRKLLSDTSLVIAYKVLGTGEFDSIEIERGNHVLNRICMTDGSTIVCIKLIGWFDGGVSSTSRAASIEFTLNDSSETPSIEGDKKLLIRGLNRRVKLRTNNSEETGAKSSGIKPTVDKSEETGAISRDCELIKTLREIIKMCDEAISKHGAK